MKVDRNKGITAITYNHLNLPKKITFSGSNRYIEYLYDATGVKLQKKVTDGTGNVTTTQYSGNFIYENGVLKSMSQPEGYVDFENGISYIYQYKDHLGNIRLSYKKNGSTLEIVEANDYYPFGMKHRIAGETPVANTNPALKYKYNGKELQDELGLNMYDYGARNYDPALGRWMNIDLLAENYMNLSGYQYCLNSPLKFIDPTGMAVEEIDGGIRFTGEDAQSAFKVLTGKIKSVFVDVVPNKKFRDQLNSEKKNPVNKAWTAFAVEDLGVAATMLSIFQDNSIDNLVLSNHGNSDDKDSFFQFGFEGIELNADNSITTSEIKSYNDKGGQFLTDQEKQVLNLVRMGNKIKNGGNFIFAFCTTGKGDVGQQTLQELKTLLGDRMNIFLPKYRTRTKYGEYEEGYQLYPNYNINTTNAGWIRSMPGIKDATTVSNIAITPNNQKPLNIN